VRVILHGPRREGYLGEPPARDGSLGAAAGSRRCAVRAAIYARVSTFDQEPENQLQELRRYGEARGWTGQEYVDRGVSGSKDKRPALDMLIRDAKRRKFDVLVCWRLDRLGRNLKHLITLLEELQVLGVAFVSLAEGIDATTPAGKLQMHILGAIAEFERARIQERVRAGLARARAQGVKLGRPRRRIDPERLAAVAGLPEREAARTLGIPRSTFQRFIRRRDEEGSACGAEGLAGES
jgi:DNA invertase Pin-like site-specific DNA recombinase